MIRREALNFWLFAAAFIALFVLLEAANIFANPWVVAVLLLLTMIFSGKGK